MRCRLPELHGQRIRAPRVDRLPHGCQRLVLTSTAGGAPHTHTPGVLQRTRRRSPRSPLQPVEPRRRRHAAVQVPVALRRCDARAWRRATPGWRAWAGSAWGDGGEQSRLPTLLLCVAVAGSSRPSTRATRCSCLSAARPRAPSCSSSASTPRRLLHGTYRSERGAQGEGGGGGGAAQTLATPPPPLRLAVGMPAPGTLGWWLWDSDAADLGGYGRTGPGARFEAWAEEGGFAGRPARRN